jgi:hypothetical protein
MVVTPVTAISVADTIAKIRAVAARPSNGFFGAFCPVLGQKSNHGRMKPKA